ncbi:ogr/Delta-like zinc finger family protein [Lelliottia sp. WAP21]|uniref:ogr/Delta-like zinc finger family protein n=1 Tax=Lelliottia sp. WAP21 TaxID=2877426 RepID=UPI001E36A52F|nr:ogr/Delta-like zinc finger family protein [Lelliottia sp. WAP21]
MQHSLSYAIDEIYCPVCVSAATVRKINRKPPKLSDVYCYCSNVECGHTFVMNVSFSHTISPSALSGQGRIKELMDALPPDERQKALELLLAAKESQ